jgi:hypothetical protein
VVFSNIRPRPQHRCAALHGAMMGLRADLLAAHHVLPVCPDEAHFVDHVPGRAVVQQQTGAEAHPRAPDCHASTWLAKVLCVAMAPDRTAAVFQPGQTGVEFG